MTLLEICTAHVVEANDRDPSRPFDVLRSVPQAMRVAERVALWAIATAQGDRDVAYTREYADYWRVTERQGERDRADIRAVFDADDFDRVIVALAAEIRKRTGRAVEPPAAGALLGVDLPSSLAGQPA